MNKLTTTSKIKLLDNGIVVNKLFTASAFKEAYIVEQGLELDYMCKGEEKPLLLDVRLTSGATDKIRQMIDHNRFYSAKAIAVLVQWKIQKVYLTFWSKVIKPSIQTNFFVREKNAMNWLTTFC